MDFLKSKFIFYLQRIRKYPFRALGIFLSLIIFILGFFVFCLVIYIIIFPELSEDEILAKVRTEIIPSVVQLGCFDKDDKKESIIGTGLYFIDPITRIPSVETNAHVVLSSDHSFYGCNVYFPRPEDGTLYDSLYYTNNAYIYDNVISGLSTSTYVYGLDYAILELTPYASTTHPFPPSKKDPYNSIDDMCSISGYPSPLIGDKVYLLGYPETGADSITITEGIVSGFTGKYNEWLKISASANHGNSGGIVIGSQNGCNYGILTRATFSRGSNLGYVLSPTFIRSFIKDQTTLSPYEITDYVGDVSKLLTQKYSSLNITLKYPDRWIISTTTGKNNIEDIDIYAPYKSTLDDYTSGLFINPIPDSDNSEMEKKIQLLISYGKKKDPTGYSGEYVVRNGTTFYDFIFKDISENVYGYPVYIYGSIFRYKNVRYIIYGNYKIDDESDLYKTLIKGIIDSIELK
jgi:hypothetical protein